MGLSRRRVRIFVVGVLVSIALGAVYMVLMRNGVSQYAMSARVLYGLFFVMNWPVIQVQDAAIRAWPAPPAAGRFAFKIASPAAFLAWWWFVAVVADRLLGRWGARREAA